MTTQIRRVLAVGPVAVALLAGCAAVVDGSGSTSGSPAASSGSGATDFPSASSSVSSAAPSVSAPSLSTPSVSGVPSLAPAALTCPTAVFPAAGLSALCITTSMQPDVTDALAPSALVKTVEPSSGWRLEEGAGRYTGASTSLATAARAIRDRFVQRGAYGTTPVVGTGSSGSATCAGRPCFVIASPITIDRAFARKTGTRVKVERLAIVTIERAPGDIVYWYVTVPDLAKSLWPRIADVANSLRLV